MNILKTFLKVTLRPIFILDLLHPLINIDAITTFLIILFIKTILYSVMRLIDGCNY